MWHGLWQRSEDQSISGRTEWKIRLTRESSQSNHLSKWQSDELWNNLTRQQESILSTGQKTLRSTKKVLTPNRSQTHFMINKDKIFDDKCVTSIQKVTQAWPITHSVSKVTWNTESPKMLKRRQKHDEEKILERPIDGKIKIWLIKTFSLHR